MRIIETYYYGAGNKHSFRCGEMTVEQYEQFIRDPESTILAMLTEYNDEMPTLTRDEMVVFSTSLMGWATQIQSRVKQSSKAQTSSDDFHISIGMMMVNAKQQYSEIQRMPMRVFLAILEDLPIILGQEEYDPMRRSERIDGEALGKLRGEV